MTSKPSDIELRGAFADSAGFLLGRSTNILRSKLEKALAPMGLSVLDYVCLKMIGIQTTTSQGSLGEFYDIDQPTMVSIVDRLEASGLVVREKNPLDRRSYILRLTTKGGKVLSRARRIAANQQRQFLSPLAAEEWEQVRVCLYKLVWEQVDGTEDDSEIEATSATG